MYDIATYTCANVEKTANSQVRLNACSDYRKLDPITSQLEVVKCLSQSDYLPNFLFQSFPDQLSFAQDSSFVACWHCHDGWRL